MGIKTKKESMTECDEQPEYPGILYAEPGSLGLISNIVSALLMAVENTLTPPFSSTAHILAGIHFIVVGGILQLLAGILSFRRWDHLTGTAFVIFASLWISLGANRIQGAFVQDGDNMRYAVLSGMIGYMAVAVILCVCAVTVNYILPPVLIAMLMTLVFEGVGQFHSWARRMAAGFEIFIVITSAYAVVVMMLKGVSQRYVLPGLGNAIFDPLLIRTKGAPSSGNEKKKITKYSEPMGMGYIGNVVPATVMAFHHLGFFSDFRPALAMFIFSVLCHILASFYSFLRHDFFHAISFIVYATFWNSRAVLQLLVSMNFHDVLDSRINFYGQWTLVVVIIVIALISSSKNQMVFLFNILFALTSILSVDHIPDKSHDFTFGITSTILAIASLYIGMSSLENSVAEKQVMYIGKEFISADTLKRSIARIFCTLNEKERDNEYNDESVIDIKIVDSVVFIASTVGLTSLSAFEAANRTISLPWVLFAGVVLHLYAVRLAYAAGSLAKAYLILVVSIFWIVWAIILFDDDFATALRPVAIGLLCLFTIGILMTLTFNRVWMCYGAIMEICFIFLVLYTFTMCPSWMILITSLLAALVSLYGACAELVNTTLVDHLVPVGSPLIREKSDKEEHASPPCPLFISRRTSALKQVAALLDEGAVVGVPTDTVYALGASCKHPPSIKKIYHIKGRPAEKPICVCLSSLDQLEEVQPPFSPLLWNFMRRCYPGGISCVVKKGEWLRRLGMGDSVDYVGTAESICIRVPDSSVLSYLVSLTGPIAITSANPSGGEDSTHHSMVVSSLGEKLDGVVCDGKSNELVASTVVNCMKIDEGVISYFRVGCTPVDIVNQHFEDAKADIDLRSSTVDILY